MKKILVLFIVLLLLTGCSPKAKYTVGVIQLIQHDALDNATKGFEDTLKKEFGDEVLIDIENAAGESATCVAIATSFVADEVDLILGNATASLQAAAHATTTIPVLGTAITEYGVALELENFDKVVGSNVSGTSDLAPLDEQAQMIIDLLPNTKTVGILYCATETNSIYQVNEIEKYLNNNNIKTEVVKFSDSNDLQVNCESLCSTIDVLYIPTDNVCAANGLLISTIAEKYNVPIFCGEKSACETMNGVATLSIDYYNLGVVTGKMAISILKGEADISTMEIRYDESPLKMYNKDACDKYNIVVPSDYVEIGK